MEKKGSRLSGAYHRCQRGRETLGLTSSNILSLIYLLTSYPCEMLRYIITIHILIKNEAFHLVNIEIDLIAPHPPDKRLEWYVLRERREKLAFIITSVCDSTLQNTM